MLRPESAVAVPDRTTVTFGATTCAEFVIVTAGGVGVIRNAAFASSKPAPHSPVAAAVVHQEPAGKGRADDCKMDRTCAGVRVGLTDKSSAATPATSAAEPLVPSPNRKVSAPGLVRPVFE